MTTRNLVNSAVFIMSTFVITLKNQYEHCYHRIFRTYREAADD